MLIAAHQRRMLCVSAKPRRFLALNGGIEALMTCLKYGMGPADDVPGVDESKQADLQEFGAKQWLKKRGPTINPDTMLTHKVTLSRERCLGFRDCV